MTRIHILSLIQLGKWMSLIHLGKWRKVKLSFLGWIITNKMMILHCFLFQSILIISSCLFSCRYICQSCKHSRFYNRFKNSFEESKWQFAGLVSIWLGIWTGKGRHRHWKGCQMGWVCVWDGMCTFWSREGDFWQHKAFAERGLD